MAASRPTTAVTDSRTTPQTTPHAPPDDATSLVRSPSNNPNMKLIRQNALRRTAATRPTGGRTLRAANQARTSCAAPTGSGTVNLVSKPHASPHVLTPEETARKPPITSQTNSTSMATMRRRPEAIFEMVAAALIYPNAVDERDGEIARALDAMLGAA